MFLIWYINKLFSWSQLFPWHLSLNWTQKSDLKLPPIQLSIWLLFLKELEIAIANSFQDSETNFYEKEILYPILKKLNPGKGTWTTWVINRSWNAQAVCWGQGPGTAFKTTPIQNEVCYLVLLIRQIVLQQTLGVSMYKPNIEIGVGFLKPQKGNKVRTS